VLDAVWKWETRETETRNTETRGHGDAGRGDTGHAQGEQDSDYDAGYDVQRCEVQSVQKRVRTSSLGWVGR